MSSDGDKCNAAWDEFNCHEGNVFFTLNYLISILYSYFLKRNESKKGKYFYISLFETEKLLITCITNFYFSKKVNNGGLLLLLLLSYKMKYMFILMFTLKNTISKLSVLR